MESIPKTPKAAPPTHHILAAPPINLPIPADTIMIPTTIPIKFGQNHEQSPDLLLQQESFIKKG